MRSKGEKTARLVSRGSKAPGACGFSKPGAESQCTPARPNLPRAISDQDRRGRLKAKNLANSKRSARRPRTRPPSDSALDRRRARETNGRRTHVRIKDACED